MDNKNLYLKYKNKYTNLKNQIGGGIKNVVSALFFKDTVYLVQENNGQWNLPGGGINKGEDYKTASFREFKEETGGFLLDEWICNILDNNNKPVSFREFKEETGGFLLDEWICNILDNNNKPVIKKYIYKTHTKILLYYLIKTFDKPNIIFKKNNETINGQWFNIEQLPDKIRFPKSMDSGNFTSPRDSHPLCRNDDRCPFSCWRASPRNSSSNHRVRWRRCPVTP